MDFDLFAADEETKAYRAEKKAAASLVLIRMVSDERLPRDALGYVQDLHFHETAHWRFVHDRLTMLGRHIPDLVKEFAAAIGFYSHTQHCGGCQKPTVHVGPRAEYCEVCGHTSGDFDH